MSRHTGDQHAGVTPPSSGSIDDDATTNPTMREPLTRPSVAGHAAAQPSSPPPNVQVIGGVPQLDLGITQLSPGTAVTATPSTTSTSSTVSPTLSYGDFKPGVVVSKWKLLEKIGKGGSAKVFKVQHTETHRYAAMKVLAAQRKGAELEVQLSKLAAEVRTFNEKVHPSIVHHLDANLSEPTYWIVTELLDGRPLDEVIKDGGPMSTNLLLHYAGQIASGLSVVHGFGVIHRDLKPTNILVSDAHLATVIDFGESRFRTARTQHQLYGTVGYTPVEMLMDKDNTKTADGRELADGRIDVYQVGLIMYEMATGGENPFTSGRQTNGEVIQAIVHLEPPSLEQVVGPHTWAIIWRALRKHPDDRFASMADMAVAIQSARQALGYHEDLDRTSLLASIDSFPGSPSLPVASGMTAAGHPTPGGWHGSSGVQVSGGYPAASPSPLAHPATTAPGSSSPAFAPAGPTEAGVSADVPARRVPVSLVLGVSAVLVLLVGGLAGAVAMRPPAVGKLRPALSVLEGIALPETEDPREAKGEQAPANNPGDEIPAPAATQPKAPAAPSSSSPSPPSRVAPRPAPKPSAFDKYKDDWME